MLFYFSEVQEYLSILWIYIRIMLKKGFPAKNMGEFFSGRKKNVLLKAFVFAKPLRTGN